LHLRDILVDGTAIAVFQGKRLRNCGYALAVTSFRIRQAAELLGVSDDTVRRWADSGRLPTTLDSSNRRVVDGEALARFAQDVAAQLPATSTRTVARSARNHFRGLVTSVVRDTVMAQVEMQAGPFRVVSLMSREAADDLGLAPGVLAVASVKSTNVVVEIPES
jgi:molybdopterin-binding protein